MGPDLWEVIVGVGHGLTPNRRQAIIYTSENLFDICGNLGLIISVGMKVDSSQMAKNTKHERRLNIAVDVEDRKVQLF